MDTKKATDVKDNRLYECFVASGGCSFLETFKLCMYEVLSQNLINEMQKRSGFAIQAGPPKIIFNYAN
jgi:hypothetical protein